VRIAQLKMELPQNVALWKQYVNTADQYSLKQIQVAVKLMEKFNDEARASRGAIWLHFAVRPTRDRRKLHFIS